MAKDVKCTVDACHYWSAGNKCHADLIEVNHNMTALNQRAAGTRMEVGEIDTMASSKAFSAKHSDQTRCNTFKPR